MGPGLQSIIIIYGGMLVQGQRKSHPSQWQTAATSMQIDRQMSSGSSHIANGYSIHPETDFMDNLLTPTHHITRAFIRTHQHPDRQQGTAVDASLRKTSKA